MKFSRVITNLVLTLGLARASVAWGGAIVSIPVVVAGGPALDVPVNISGVSDLYAFQFDLSYDPSIIHVTSLSEGAFLPAGGSTFFLPGSIDNALGTLSMTADSLAGAIPGLSGSGQLAVVRFAVLASGISPLTLSSITLLDSNLNDIPFSVSNGQVIVPEPGFAPLVGLSLMVAIALRGRAA